MVSVKPRASAVSRMDTPSMSRKTKTMRKASGSDWIAAERRLVFQVGHLERFNPAVQATLPVITKPMFFEVHRLSVFTPRSLDVDVVLDLMIHDLDIILSMVKEPIVRLDAIGGRVISDHEDIVKATLYFKSGCRADLSASRVNRTGCESKCPAHPPMKT